VDSGVGLGVGLDVGPEHEADHLLSREGEELRIAAKYLAAGFDYGYRGRVRSGFR